jgi:two-component system chemotaxis response regulator CheB
VALAGSTGGPAALQRILGDLPARFPAPVLVVQHIARGFVGGLADWLNTGGSMRVKVAQSGDPLTPRTVFLAPDDRHLVVGPDRRLLVDAAPPVNGFRPSATRLFESVARAYGREAAAVILTGMGDDGVAGLQLVKANGGYVIAQDQETSVVYGMPREAVAAGVVDAVLPVDEIGTRLAELVAERE